MIFLHIFLSSSFVLRPRTPRILRCFSTLSSHLRLDLRALYVPSGLENLVSYMEMSRFLFLGVLATWVSPVWQSSLFQGHYKSRILITVLSSPSFHFSSWSINFPQCFLLKGIQFLLIPFSESPALTPLYKYRFQYGYRRIHPSWCNIWQTIHESLIMKVLQPADTSFPLGPTIVFSTSFSKTANIVCLSMWETKISTKQIKFLCILFFGWFRYYIENKRLRS
jgi:hypothetical protein